MGFFEFPHTRTYDSDLGWLIRQCKTNMDAIVVLEDWKNNTQEASLSGSRSIFMISSERWPRWSFSV